MQNTSEKSNRISTLLKGAFIADRNNHKHIPFLLLLVILILININLSFRAEGLLKKSTELEQEVVELRLVYITTKSELMHMYKRTVVEQLVSDIGLITSTTPPIIIKRNTEIYAERN